MKHVRFAATIDGGLPVSLDVERMIDTRLLIQANSGGGKSYALRKILEVTHGKVQHLVIDAEGEFNSLRERFDYVYIAQGEKIVPDPATAGQLALMLLELGVSAIVDIYELHPRDRKRFVRAFLDALIAAPRKLWHPVFVVVDEAHEFAPESERSESLEAVVALESKGRKREFCGALATQRFSKLSKDAAAELQNKIIGLANYEMDRMRSGDELGFNKGERLILRDLEPGQMFVTGPAFYAGEKRVKEPVLVQIDEVTTPHGRKAKKWHPPKAAKAGKIQKALEALAALPKRAEEEGKTIADLQRQLRDAKRELADAKRAAARTGPSPEEIETIRAEVRKETQIEEQRKMAKSKNRLLQLIEQMRITVERDYPGETAPAETPKTIRAMPPRAEVVQIRRQAPHGHTVERGDRTLARFDRLALNLLINVNGQSLTKAQVGGWTGYSVTSSSFDKGLSTLRTAGLIQTIGDRISLAVSADEAIKTLGSEYDPNFAPSIDGWVNRLRKAPRLFFNVLKEAGGAPVTKDDLAAATGYSITSSSFDKAVSELCSKKLAERVDHGAVRLNPDLLNG